LHEASSFEWSPASTHLAFQQSSPDGGQRLYIASADLSDVRELPPHEGAVAWSPDGSQLAFAACYGKGLHLATTDGGNRYLANVSPHNSPYLPSRISWSPDGKRLAFHRYNETLQGFSIEIIDAETGELQSLGQGEQPVWSSGGSQIAFTRDGQLFRMPSGGGPLTQMILPVQPFIDSPSWSFGDSGVLFHYAPWYLRSIRSVQANGQEQHLAYGDEPIWSPDSSRIAFIGRALNAGLAGTNEIYVMNADGSGVHKVGYYNWSDVGTCTAPVSSTADGKYVKFSTVIAPADASSPQQILDEPCSFRESPPSDTVYSPNGRAVLVVR
jgi:Tol biopolymer transport system component